MEELFRKKEMLERQVTQSKEEMINLKESLLATKEMNATLEREVQELRFSNRKVSLSR